MRPVSGSIGQQTHMTSMTLCPHYRIGVPTVSTRALCLCKIVLCDRLSAAPKVACVTAVSSGPMGGTQQTKQQAYQTHTPPEACPFADHESRALHMTVFGDPGVGMSLCSGLTHDSCSRSLQRPCLAKKGRGRLTRALALDTRAMVNVDFSPALLLGMSLIAGGLALYQLRRLQPDISRDFDVVVSAVATFSGGILIFQVRCDP